MSGAKASLFILDDDPGVVDYLREALAAHGYHITGSTRPEEALTEIIRGDYDLVISDVEMPGLRGPDFLRAVLAERPQQLVLLITAFGSIDLAVEVVRAGAVDFVAKPFKIEVLVL